MADLLSLSTKVIDEGINDGSVGPLNRVTHELSELADGLSMVEAFSHSIVFKTDDGLVVFDTSGKQGGKRVVDSIRGWSPDHFNTLVYTHGHIDHVGGSGAFIEDTRAKTGLAPKVVGHENIPRRFARYELTNGYNNVINTRQFGSFRRRGYDIGDSDHFLPRDAASPDVTYSDRLGLNVGGLDFDLHHAIGETDDHTWAWIPKYKAICAGDFFIWNFPNAGNPQKVQRYPVEWAAAMRDMAGMGAELFLPAHGLPIQGAERIRMVLTDVASALENLVRETLIMMNDGARLNDIIHSVSVAQEILDKPYLNPMYDEPEFVIHNIWRLYGGWYDGNPANLKPAPENALAAEIAALAGGSNVLAQRAEALADAGDFRLACHLAELAVQADADNVTAHGIRADVYQRRRNNETSLMAKGIFGYAANESKAMIEDKS